MDVQKSHITEKKNDDHPNTRKKMTTEKKDSLKRWPQKT